MSENWQKMFVGDNLTALIALTNQYLGYPDRLLEAICMVPGVPDSTRSAMTRPATVNTLSGLAPIEYLACGLLKHSRNRVTPQILADWALGAEATPMRINRIRILATAFFA